MFKQFIAAILLIAFIAGTFSKNLLVADYYLNTNAYAKNCINKAKPKLRCNGKCQMMKKLQEEEKNENQQNEHREQAKNQIVSSKSFFATTHNIVFTEINNNAFALLYTHGTPVAMPRSCFHPPSV
ncbi:hypothetical protein ACFOWM_08210 [Ferruginibacter yonginensis]|uniref:Secreted protein n=1 Tax=Ferruginibacter yonginensis TaxID=1310416 RepID=A0ABV8QSM4_9BACT